MKTKIKTRSASTHTELPNQGIWTRLSDKEKAKLLLGSKRLIDEEKFLDDFRSWEQPESPDELNNQSNL